MDVEVVATRFVYLCVLVAHVGCIHVFDAIVGFMVFFFKMKRRPKKNLPTKKTALFTCFAWKMI